jgi:hypothetical protein
MNDDEATEKHHPYTAIVLGSGCSVGLGIPTMFNFMDAALHKLNGEPRHWVTTFLKTVKGSSAYIGSDLLNIEEVYGLADLDDDLTESSAGDDDTQATMVKRALNQAIFKVAAPAGHDFVDPSRRSWFPDDLNQIRRESRTAVPVHRNFGSRYTNLLAYLCLAAHVDFVSEQERRPMFIQFNWDLALDRALLRCFGLPLDPPDRFPWYAPDLAHDFSERPLVTRPHGGIHWSEVRKEDVGEAEAAGLHAVVPDDGDEVQIWADPHLVCAGAVAEPAERWTGPSMAVVPPTWRKQATRGAYRRQWAQIKQGLAFVRRIVFVGYSLPKSDLYFRHFLALALAENQFNPKVYVWNPSIGNEASDTYQSYCDLFQPLARQDRLFGIAGSFGDPAFFDLDRTLQLAKPLRG